MAQGPDITMLDATLTSLPQQCAVGADQKLPAGPAPGAATLSSWLRALGDLQRSVAGSQAFFEQAARAVHEPGGLEGGIILLPSRDGWEIAASHSANSNAHIDHRADLVELAVDTKETIFHDTRNFDADLRDCQCHSAVVSPVFDHDGKPIAAIYGFRRSGTQNNRQGIRKLEAQFVQVISDSISAAMTRMEAEARAAKSRALLDQTFSPTVARQLENDPGFLEGKTTEVTVMFVDLRGFSSISEAIGPKLTYELLTDIMDCFSSIVSDYDGVVIDFFGDGLAAFWNAPIEQPEHPLFACHCAIEMLESLTGLNQQWQDRLGRELKIGIGIHTGMAQVGNSGSRTRLKYGPQGNTVNIANRIESMTREVGCPLIVSAATAERISAAIPVRGICRSQLKGIQQPIELFEALTNESKQLSPEYIAAYAQAQAAFDAERFQQATQLLTNLKSKQTVTDPVVDYLLGQAKVRAQQPVAPNSSPSPLSSSSPSPSQQIPSV